MLKQQLRQIVQANPDYAANTPVIEKEILHLNLLLSLIGPEELNRVISGISSGSNNVA